MEDAPSGCGLYHKTLLTDEALCFVAKLMRQFDQEIVEVNFCYNINIVTMNSLHCLNNSMILGLVF